MASLDPLNKAAGVKNLVTGQPTAEGVAGTAVEVAKGAVKGAATKGGLTGAAAGAATSFAQTKAGRRVLVILALIILVNFTAVPIFMVSYITLTATALAGGDEERSTEAVVASGKDEEHAASVMSTGFASGVPWELLLALESVQAEDDIDIALLSDVLNDAGLLTIGAGGVRVEGSGMVEGKGESNVAAAEAERTAYVAALQRYGLTETQAASVYKLARAWALGTLEVCPAGQFAADTEFQLADGSSISLSETQLANARTLLSAARGIDGMSDDAMVVMLMAALTESSLLNYANSSVEGSEGYDHDAVGSDHDSLGFFQMRSNWGTVAQRMNPAYQVKAFFGDGPAPGLFDIEGWQAMSKGEAAQAVEVSAFPDRYAKYEELAATLVRTYGGANVTNCGGIAGDVGHPLGDMTWGISSAYGPREVVCAGGSCTGNFHYGIDFYASGDKYCDYPIYAVADGVVTHIGPEGSWGNTVVILHDDGTKTRYAHQPDDASSIWPAEGTRVTKGQQIGKIGSTGVSEACHLHFEVIKDGKRVDPYVALRASGLDLAWSRALSDEAPAGATIVDGPPQKATVNGSSG